MNSKALPLTPGNDTELVAQSLAGNSCAFGRIVARYQSLVCAPAFSATGNISRSEDLAQETFVIAWQHLRGLREPEKLRSWLCGIARNTINISLRREVREPAHAAAPLEAPILGISVSDMHRLLPMGIMHILTLGLLCWTAALLALTAPRSGNE